MYSPSEASGRAVPVGAVERSLRYRISYASDRAIVRPRKQPADTYPLGYRDAEQFTPGLAAEKRALEGGRP